MLKAMASKTDTEILLTMHCGECGAASQMSIALGTLNSGAADSNLPLNLSSALEGALHGGRES